MSVHYRSLSTGSSNIFSRGLAKRGNRRHNYLMKRTSLLLGGVFLFGVYALPGRVCANAGASARLSSSAAEAKRPSCHPGEAVPDRSPCGKMVCCLLPDVSRGTATEVVLPSPIFSGGVAHPAHPIFLGSDIVSRRISFDSHPPPGHSRRLFSSTSPRGPPLA